MSSSKCGAKRCDRPRVGANWLFDQTVPLKLKTFVSAVVPLEEASIAYSGAVRDKRGYGKVVIAISI